MKYETIAEIYEGNNKIRQRLIDTLNALTAEQAKTVPDGEKWSIEQIVEHIAIVDESTLKICSKLLKKAQESPSPSASGVMISNGFLQKGTEVATIKLEAPSFVQPSGEQSIAESLTRLEDNAKHAEEMRPLFESVDGTTFKFPHPFFGDISAQEWLALKGGHELRHLKQIQKVLGKIA
jgi:hypothetical protein